MATDEGRDLIHALSRQADCVLASFKPGDAEKLGVDGATLTSLNDRLVYAQITGYGLDNPRLGYDAVVQAESGFQFMNGEPDSGPCKMPVALIDVITAHQVKEAMLLQLWRRERTGKGGVVNASLMGSAVTALVNQATAYLIGGHVPQRLGSDHPTIAPYGTVFDTRDAGKQVTLGVGSDAQFRSLCAVIGRDAMAAEGSKFARNPDRCANRRELNETLSAAFREWDRDELLKALAAAKIPSGAVNDMADAFKQPRAEELVIRDGEGQAVGLRQISFKGCPEGVDGQAPPLSPPPHFGEHTREVLGELLGLDAVRLDELAAKGVIG
mmetsp:Transcript_25527/g.81203  ORF Transcript_25527/g.81203 Transcript_25527/m.81203 type:complete len:326 (-) Transcript_25527:261-1238(-)